MTLVVDTLELYGGVSYVSTLFEAQTLAAGASAVSDAINIAQETYSIHVFADFGASGALTITALIENSDPESDGLTPAGYANICTGITSEGVYSFSLPPGVYRRLKITNTGGNSVTTTVVLAAQGRDRGEKGDPGAAAPSVMFRPYDGYIQWYDFDAGVWRNLTSENWGTENLSIVAGAIANVNATGANIADVTTVAESIADVTTVSESIADVSLASNAIKVAGIDSEVVTVAGEADNVAIVAGIESEVVTVAGEAANVAIVAGIESEVVTVSGEAANVAIVAGWLNAGGAAASNMAYDNSASGLEADDVQGAIDEEASRVAALDEGVVALEESAGNYRGVLSSSAATVTLTAEHRGYLVVLYSGSSQTLLFPQEAELAAGWSVTILKKTLTGSALIDTYSQIDSGNGLVNSLTMRGMEEARLTWDGTVWRLGGSALRAVGESASGGIRDVTGSRNFGTTYTNLTLRPMILAICYRDGGAGAPTLTVTDSQGAHEMALSDLATSDKGQISVMIEPGADWRMSTTGTTKVAVWEYYL